MTHIPSPVGEDDLQAWVDGRLPDNRRAAVEAYLQDHLESAAQAQAERVQRDALRAELAAKFVEPIPARLRLSAIRATQKANRNVWMRNAAAAALFVALGSAGGWLAKGAAPQMASTPTATLSQDALAAYRTFVVEVAHPVEVRAADETHLVQWLSKRLGRPLRAPDLASFGYRLMGGRLLPAGDTSAAMLMYDDDNGSRLTVYIRAGEGGETAFRFRRDGEVGTFAWIDQGFGFAVSASTTRERLLPIADAVYHDLDAGSARSLPPRGG